MHTSSRYAMSFHRNNLLHTGNFDYNIGTRVSISAPIAYLQEKEHVLVRNTQKICSQTQSEFMLYILNATRRNLLPEATNPLLNLQAYVSSITELLKSNEYRCIRSKFSSQTLEIPTQFTQIVPHTNKNSTRKLTEQPSTFSPNKLKVIQDSYDLKTLND
jgi:hypothetical protein